MTSGLAILAIGFVLGMRHATDPDHVIAVSTIVSRERSILKAGLIGVLWGVGHTLTILVVGAGIILFDLAIPTRVGLTMEFSVGLMLILLGVLNLTGAMSWISEKFSPAHPQVTGSHAHLHRARLEGAPPLAFAQPGAGASRRKPSAAKMGRGRVRPPGFVSHVAAIVRRAGSWTRRLSRCCIVGSQHHPRTSVGGAVPADLRSRHNRGNDADYRGDCSAVFLCRL